MKKQNYSIKIKASKEKVWNTLWNDATYKMWTSVFSEGSYAVSDWNEGSKILFLSAEGGGMYSIIAKKTPNEFMSFKHLGVVKDGKEEPLDEESKKWSGSLENYKLQEIDGFTELSVQMDVTDEFLNYFDETFPKALEKIKELAEK
jgi:hypothetical protein